MVQIKYPRQVAARAFTIWLVAGVVLINLFVIGVAGVCLHQSRRLYESRVATQTQNLSRSLSLTIGAIIDKTNIALFSAGRNVERQIGKGPVDKKFLNHYLIELQENIPELEGIRVANAQGEIVYGDGAESGPRVNIADRDFFFRARQNPKSNLIISRPMRGRISGLWVFYIVRRVNNPDGSFAGVVAAAVSLDYLSKVFSSFDLGADGVVTLRDGKLDVVVRFPEPAGQWRTIGSKKVSAELTALVQRGNSSGTYTTKGNIDFTTRTFSYNKIAHYPLYVNAGLSSRDYLAPWYKEVKQLLSLLTLFTLGTLVSAWLIYRNRKRKEALDAELQQYRELLEETVRERTAELETRNTLLADEIVLRRQAQADVERAAIVLDRMPDAVEWISREGRFLYVNDAACRLQGYSREELLSLSIGQIVPHFSAGNWLLHWEELKREGYLNFEMVNISRSGIELPVEVTANYLELNGVECNCAIIRDVSERKAAESEKQHLMVQLNHSQKIESIGRLAGGISHDFNNLLTPILGYSELLMGSLPSGGAEHKRASNIMLAADRAKVLTQQLLSFSRKQILDMKTVDLNEVIRSFYDILRRTIPETISIRLGLTETVYGIHADSNQIEQIIMNLVINAKDAITGSGVVKLETARVTLDAEYARQHAGVVPGQYLMLAVTDSGSGMSRETLDHVFEPFFTTKSVGKGTGLGLATVHGIVKQHEGHIWAYSELGKGTVFKIYFPLSDAVPTPEIAVVSEAAGEISPGGCILLVDDNEMVRTMARDLLESHGFRIIVAEDPLLALHLSAGQQIDLLLTDVVMPGMDGFELHKTLLEEHRDMKVLFMSGYTDTVMGDYGANNALVNFVQKPFAVDVFVNKINLLMNCSPPGS
jgi:two-component system, cell cycle sensor histidine kinase and response regulator CckA